MGDVLTDAAPERECLRGGRGGVCRIGIEGDLTVERRKEGVQQREIVAIRSGLCCLRKVDDRGVGPRQRGFAQEKLRRKTFDGALHQATGVLRVDFTVDLNAQSVERTLGRERMNYVAEGIFVLVQKTIFGQVDPPGQDVLSLMVAWG